MSGPLGYAPLHAPPPSDGREEEAAGIEKLSLTQELNTD